MPLDSLVTTCARTQQWCHLLFEQGAQANGVELDQFWEHLSEFALEILLVLLHLTGEVPLCQHRVDAGIDSGVDVGGKMVLQIADTVSHQVLRQGVEHVTH